MLKSESGDSIEDDDLFVSGPVGWQGDQQSGVGTNAVHPQPAQNTADGLIIMMNDLCMDGDTDGPSPNRQYELPRSVGMNSAGIGAPVEQATAAELSSPNQENTDPVVRKKIIKNQSNSNKNKNGAPKKKRNNPAVLNSDLSFVMRSVPDVSSDTSWSPKLQIKRYDQDLESNGGRPKNNSKQKKQNINVNVSMNNQVVDDQQSAMEPDAMTNLWRVGVNPNSDPKNVTRIYGKSRQEEGQRQPAMVPIRPVAEENQFISVHDTPGKQDNHKKQTSVKFNDASNVTWHKNNLWDDRKSHEEETFLKKQPENSNPVNIIHNNLATNNGENYAASELTNPLNGHRQSSNTDFNRGQIVAPFVHRSLSDSSLQVNDPSLTPNALNIDSLTSVPYSTAVHPSSRSSSIVTEPESLTRLDSYSNLPSNLPSDILFGDGTSDYFIAQQLQRKFDEENTNLQYQRQYDLVPNMSLNSLTSLDDTELKHFNVADSADMNHYRISDGEADDMYNPNALSNSFPGLSLIGPNERNLHGTDTTQKRANDNVTRVRDYVLPERHEMPEPSDCRGPVLPVPQQIAIPDSRRTVSVPQQIATESRGTMVTVPQQISTPNESLGGETYSYSIQDDSETSAPGQFIDDEALARRLQEEEYARERGDDSYHLHQLCPHHGASAHGTMSPPQHDDSLPLHARYDQNWTNRPLRVGPPVGGASNVADSRIRGSAWERPLRRREIDFSYMDNVRDLPLAPVREGYDIPPDQYRDEYDPDNFYGIGDEHFISMNRDPHMLASLLMARDPNMMVPNEIDLNDYEALWELAEGLGEVRRVGMEASDISLLPVHTYQAPAENSTDTKTDCNVCLSAFLPGEKLRTLPCCHIYHVECIDEWLKRNAVCPVCRQSASPRQ